MPRAVSPAAAAAVSRLLREHNVRRASEFRKGIEYEGFWAEPRGDHVRVDYTPDWDVDPSDAVVRIYGRLDQCRSILLQAGYDVCEVIEPKYVYGGNPPMSMPVLEVRNADWTKRDGD